MFPYPSSFLNTNQANLTVALTHTAVKFNQSSTFIILTLKLRCPLVISETFLLKKKHNVINAESYICDLITMPMIFVRVFIITTKQFYF